MHPAPVSSSSGTVAEVPAAIRPSGPETSTAAPAVPAPTVPAAEASNEAQNAGANSSPAAAPSGQPAAERYLLQIYSFRSLAPAEAEAAQFKKDGYPSFAKLDGKDSEGVWYGVYVGPFDDLSAASKVASNLRSSRAISPVLRRLSPQ